MNAGFDPLEHLSRVAGLTAYILVWLNVCVGLGLRAGVYLPLIKRWRVADLHQFFGLLSLVFLGLHIGVLIGLKREAFSVAELWLPQLRSLQAAVGITALYLLVAVAATSYLRRYVSLRVWRAVHGLSVLAYVLGLTHALMAGSASAGSAGWERPMYLLTNALLVFLIARRVLHKERGFPYSPQPAVQDESRHAIPGEALLLHGRLDPVSFIPLLRFISKVGWTGALRLTHEAWTAEVFFEGGRVVDARLRDQLGLAALGALMIEVDGVKFEFYERAPRSVEAGGHQPSNWRHRLSRPRSLHSRRGVWSPPPLPHLTRSSTRS